MDKRKVLFVCVYNSGRSQMAEAIFNQLAREKAIASSAGTQPSATIDPTVVQVMHEAGLDIRLHQPKLLTIEMMESADKVISMGCGVEETCPAGLVPMEDWGIEDPAGKALEKVREIRDIIRGKVETLVNELYLEAHLELKGGER
jgi:arsenate reductase (thioredoxin)